MGPQKSRRLYRSQAGRSNHHPTASPLVRSTGETDLRYHGVFV
jgi:hypothetical protein